MEITHQRVQHPVGQGFFHTARIGFGHSSQCFSYVYDCGAMKEYEKSRDAAIHAYIKRIGKGQRLDLLVISHMHADHVNGVRKLLDDGEFKVDTVMLPLVSMHDRLLAFGKAAHDDPSSAGSQFYMDFVADPTRAISEFKPRNILQVYGSPGKAPGSDISDEDPPEIDGDSSISGEGQGLLWKLVGTGRAEVLPNAPNEPCVVEIPDSAGISISEIRTSDSAWLLAPFIDQGVAGKETVFLKALANAMGVEEETLRCRLDDPVYVRNLLANTRDKLAYAYSTCSRNLNLTSLCLYSGPADREYSSVSGLIQGSWFLQGTPGRVAWLGTGDAQLSGNGKCTEFLEHYGFHLSKVMTLTLPHHGSVHGFNELLLTGIAPDFCLVSADKLRNWQHPAAAVARAVSNTGSLLVTSTSKESTLAEENVWIRGVAPISGTEGSPNQGMMRFEMQAKPPTRVSFPQESGADHSIMSGCDLFHGKRC